MDQKKYRDEFEQFLHDEVKQHRMYPSDHVWSNIRTELHGHRSWPALTFISVFIITALTLSTLLSTQQQTARLQPVSAPNVLMIQQETIAANNAATEKSRRYFNTLAPVAITENTIASLEENTVEESMVAANSIVPGTTIAINQIRRGTNGISSSSRNMASLPLLNPESIVTTTSGSTITAENTTNLSTEKNNVAEDDLRNNLLQQTSENDPNADDFLKDFNYVEAKKLNKKSASKFGFQFYITPSTSYRRLSDEKVKDIIQPAVASLPVNAPLNQPSDVNQVVRHRPAIGMEIGFALLYNISSRLKLKTGLQLNIRQYHIETFQSMTYDRATISLINFNGVENITRYSPYNNNVGFKQTELDNKVYQVAIPIGVQWEIIKGKHLGVNAEASVQPTLNLNKSVYLLSTDYRHYADGNDFVRKWNINTSVGFNISYTAGKTTWQLGPQVRYQHLPTYSNKYPIKEYLMDYGIRIGLTKALQ